MGDPDQLNANPYEPTSQPTELPHNVPSHSRGIRFAICFHLIVVGVSIAVSRIDTGMLSLPALFEAFIYSLMYPCLLAMFFCPALVLYYTLRSDLSRLRRALVIAVDAGIAVANFFALLPLVQ